MAKKMHPPHSHTPKDFAEAYKLSLPSFGIDIYRSAPEVRAIAKGEMPPSLSTLFYKSGDAFSATYMYEGEDILPPVDQSFLPLRSIAHMIAQVVKETLPGEASPLREI